MNNEQRKKVICKSVITAKLMFDMPMSELPRIFVAEEDTYYFVSPKTGEVYSDHLLMSNYKDELADRLSPNYLVKDKTRLATVDRAIVRTLSATIRDLSKQIYLATQEMENDN